MWGEEGIVMGLLDTKWWAMFQSEQTWFLSDFSHYHLLVQCNGLIGHIMMGYVS